MPQILAIRPAEDMTMIDKEGIEPSPGIFNKNSLPVIDVAGANIDQPRQPKAVSVTDSLEAG